MGTWAQVEKQKLLGVQVTKNLVIQNYFSVETSHVIISIYLEATFVRAIGPIKLLSCRLFGNAQEEGG